MRGETALMVRPGRGMRAGGSSATGAGANGVSVAFVAVSTRIKCGGRLDLRFIAAGVVVFVLQPVGFEMRLGWRVGSPGGITRSRAG